MHRTLKNWMKLHESLYKTHLELADAAIENLKIYCIDNDVYNIILNMAIQIKGIKPKYDRI